MSKTIKFRRADDGQPVMLNRASIHYVVAVGAGAVIYYDRRPASTAPGSTGYVQVCESAADVRRLLSPGSRSVAS